MDIDPHLKVAIVMHYRIFDDCCQGLIADWQDEESDPWYQRSHLRVALLYRHLGLTDPEETFRRDKNL